MTLWVLFGGIAIIVAVVAILTVTVLGGITIFEPLIKANREAAAKQKQEGNS